MKFARFISADDSIVRSGVVSGQEVQEIQGDLFGKWEYTGITYALEAVHLTSPLAANHIIGIGKNFVPAGQDVPAAPAIPIFFFKPLTSVIGPEEPIVIPRGYSEIKFESELAAVIGKTGRHIPENQVQDYIFGYTVANDLALLNLFHEEGHWTIGKSFDTFCPLGPVIETELSLSEVRVEAYLNGGQKQDSPLSLMITSVEQMISCISGFMTLQPGDVILTGTPAGADFVRDGDVIECRIAQIGTLSNPVVGEK